MITKFHDSWPIFHVQWLFHDHFHFPGFPVSVGTLIFSKKIHFDTYFLGTILNKYMDLPAVVVVWAVGTSVLLLVCKLLLLSSDPHAPSSCPTSSSPSTSSNFRLGMFTMTSLPLAAYPWWCPLVIVWWSSHRLSRAGKG